MGQKMDEAFKEKARSLKTILGLLEQHPHKFGELFESVKKETKLKIKERTLHRHLDTLLELNLIVYDDKEGEYCLPQSKKQVFESKHDYDLALKHSRLLVFSTKETQRFDQMDPFLALDVVVFFDDPLNRDIDNECVMQHLKTGYYKEVYVFMQKYRQLLDKTGVSLWAGLPKLFSSEFAGETPSEIVVQASTLKDEYIKLPRRYGLGASKDEFIHVHRKEMKEIYDLRNLLVGKLYSIVNDVRNGIPMRGYCDHCPHHKLTIKEQD